MSPRTSARLRTTALAVGTGVLVLSPVAVVPAASADTSVGSVFAPGANDCGNNTLFQTSTADLLYRVPSAGVLTSWRFQPGADIGTAVALKVGRFTGPATGTVVGSSETVPVTSAALVQRTTRISVQAGDVLGLWGDGDCANATVPGDAYAFAPGNAPAGAAFAGTASTGYRLDIAATLEPDADSDGFGDTTQDQCPTSAAAQKECVAPVTTITKLKARPAVRATRGAKPKGKVKARFSVNEAATSTCSVDGRRARSCSSPFRFKAKVGKHVVAITSTDTAGNVGATVTRKVKVKAKE